MLRLHFIGPITIEKDGQTVRDFRSQKALGLLGYLCLQKRPIPRTALVDLFWPHLNEARGRRNLSWVLSQLSRHLADCLQSTRHTVQFLVGENVWVDVYDFQDQISHENFETAVSLYQDELMAGLFLDDCPEFETWLVGEREVWRQRASQALHQAVEQCVADGRFEQAIDFTRRWLLIEPWDEMIHRQLMSLFVYSGQPSFALTHYEQCRQLLHEELGAEPEPDTTALFERIQRGELHPAPQLSVVQSYRSNIPAATRPFVGRTQEISAIIRLLTEEESRLLTIIGPGGVGKTQLALQVARQVEHNKAAFPDGVFLVSLAAVDSWEQLLTAVARALNFFETPHSDADLQTQLSTYLHQKEMLLLLDNFEHLTPFNTQLLAWLGETQKLKLLVTSRSRLNLHREWSVTLAGLAVPETVTKADLDAFSATQLFLHRMRQVRQEPLTEAEAEAVVKICRLVEGLPLAIELAAAWMRLLSPLEVWQKLEEDFDWLMTSMSDVPDRHRSLQAVVAYSWEFLPSAQQEALSKLSLFVGSFSRENAQAAAAAELKTLAHLVDQSFVDKTAAAGRFRLHPVIRHFAAKRLAERQQMQHNAQIDFLHTYQSFLKERKRRLQGKKQRHVLAEINAEIDNVSAAWQHAVQLGDAAAAQFFADTLQTLFHVYDMQSWFRDGFALFEQATDSILRETAVVEHQIIGHQLMARQGWFLFHLGKPEESRRLLEQSLDFLQKNGAPSDTLFARNYLAAVLHHLNRSQEAAVLAKANLELAQTLNAPYAQAIANNILAQIAYQRRRYQQAQCYSQQSLAIERTIGNQWSMGYSLVNLGKVAYAQQNFAEAQAHFEESLQIRQSINDLRGIAICLQRLGQCAAAQGASARARTLYQRSRDIFAELNNVYGLTTVEQQLDQLADTTAEHKHDTEF